MFAASILSNACDGAGVATPVGAGLAQSGVDSGSGRVKLAGVGFQYTTESCPSRKHPAGWVNRLGVRAPVSYLCVCACVRACVRVLCMRRHVCERMRVRV